MVDASQDRPSSPEAAELDYSGRQLGDYQLLRRLGRGAMAEVYLAEQSSLHRQVAVKVLKGSLATDESYVKRFHFEAQAAASLVHANIVQIHEVGCIDGIHYIAQEYVQGQNLRELMVRHGPPDTRLAVNIMRQVAAALYKAGERGIVHRDIKPENIMLAKTGEVKVADFGLSRAMDDGKAVNLTQVGITMGTPLYMSPEQVEGKALDPRSDIYSFGVTCYHMLAGVPPFRGDTALAVAVQHLKKQPERLEKLRPDLTRALCRIVHKMLAKDPSQRYSSARELLKDLKSLPIDGGEEVDAEGLDQISDVDLDLIAPEGTESTQRLAAVMKHQSALKPPRRWAIWLGPAIAASFLLGSGLAWLTRDPWLLANARPGVPPLATIDEQMSYAASIADPDRRIEAWESVITLFEQPEYEAKHRTAKQHLARLYLAYSRYDDALRIFEEFAGLSDLEKELKSFGLAGKYIVLSNLGKRQEAQSVFDEWFVLRHDLTDNVLQQLMTERLNAIKRDADEEQRQLIEDVQRAWREASEQESATGETASNGAG
jgi:serine/threonine protein kinase